MKDSWDHGDDRRERGRAERAPAPSRRSRSPPSRLSENDSYRDQRGRDRGRRETLIPNYDREKRRERSHDRRRRQSRESIKDSEEEVRGRNKGKELLVESRASGSDRHKRSSNRSPAPADLPASSRRRRSRTSSPSRESRSSHKKSKHFREDRSPRRGGSRSRERPRQERERHHRERSPVPSRRSSQERGDYKRSSHRAESEYSDSRGRSPSSKHTNKNATDYPASLQKTTHRFSHRNRSREGSERRRGSLTEDKPYNRRYSPSRRRRSPQVDPYISGQRPPHRRPRPHSDTRGPHSPYRDNRERSRESYRSDRPRSLKDRPRQAKASGANSVEVLRKHSSTPPATSPSGKDRGRRRSSTPAASGANSIEVEGGKMANRGFYNQGYSSGQQMQAAFPLNPHYAQATQADSRQYSQSPQHSHHNSYHNSPQAQSPFGGGRGSWNGRQQSFSPHPQHPTNQQAGYSPPTVTGNQYHGSSQSPPYHATATGPPTGPMNQYPQQHGFRGRAGYRGGYNPRGRGDHRGRGGHFQNLHWSASGNSTTPQGSAPTHSGSVTPQHASPQHAPQFPIESQSDADHRVPKSKATPSAPEEDREELFRPKKELQVEAKFDDKKKDETAAMPPPPSRPPPTGPQSQQNSSKFSFAFKASSKAVPTPPKSEIAQKLNAAPSRPSVLAQSSPERPKGPSAPRSIPTEPASARRQEPQSQPTTRKVKKIMKRAKPRPVLSDEMRKSTSVYYRKGGNDSVVGSGTYGKVYKGVHVYTKALVALKKIRMEGERDGFPVTAVREIKLLQSLKHENIVGLQEVMVENNDCFMVFEYLSHDLTGLLNHPTFKLDAGHKKDLAKQMFEGLDYLHRRGVLHRDIKAANILVSNEGRLKIADFGLARFFAKRRQLDYTNRVITIWYRSPELLLGETQYGPEVDIWSAACVLVEIFTRHAIFPGDGGEINQLDKIYAILGTPSRKEWPRLTDMAWFELLRPGVKRPNVFEEKYKDRVTPAAYHLLQTMFQYDPSKRPSASEVLAHAYFATEEPGPKQAIELNKLDGDWHEFESKALRKENERKEKELRRQAQKEKDRKRGLEEQQGGENGEREAKRVHAA